MDDKRDLQEPSSDPEVQAPEPKRRLTASEARKKHGIRLAIFLALFFWFAYDGWHNPKFQKPEKKFDMWFNRVGAYALGVFVIYHGAMFGSAALTVNRRQQSGISDEDEGDGGEPPSAG